MHVRKLLLFLGLSVADLGLTWHLLSHAGGQVYEGNPLARWLLTTYGWRGLTLFKLALALFVVSLTLVIARQQPRAAGRVLVISCSILALVVLYSGFLAGSVAACPVASGGLDAELAATLAKNQYLDQRLQDTVTYRELRERLSAELLAGHRSLPEAAALLAASGQGRDPNWLRYLARLYPGRSEEARLAANLISCVLCDLQEDDSADEDCAHRLAAAYRACYGLRFQFPEELAASGACRWRILSEEAPPRP